MAVSTGTIPGAPAAPSLGRAGVSSRRRAFDLWWWVLSAIGLVLLIVPVVWVLAGVVANAVPNWSWSIFTETTTGIGGGLANTIVGTFVLLVGVGILAGVVGIGAGVFLAEVAPPGRLTGLLRGASEVLSGIPSIVFGYVGYVALVVGLHWGFSLLAALVVLSLLVVPYVAKSTELALGQVPLAYREGGEALGMSKTHVLRRVVLRSAIPGMATGLIFALAISVGETAPLLYTAGFSNDYPSDHLVHAAVPYLTYATFTFWNQPSTAVKALSYDSALLLVFLVLVLILASRLIVRLTQRYSPNRVGGGALPRRRATRRGLTAGALAPLDASAAPAERDGTSAA
ncbi:MAG TPA: ABC transporter permease subunit [Acidimicrobiales bacterium]|nr:ABC transporter permease subunit [Acidimicrobiales bacterium]